MTQQRPGLDLATEDGERAVVAEMVEVMKANYSMHGEGLLVNLARALLHGPVASLLAQARAGNLGGPTGDLDECDALG